MRISRVLAAISFLPLLVAGCGGSGGSGTGTTPQSGQWTILVYMNAANNLDTDSVYNIEQMQQAAANPQVRIVVQWKQSTSVVPTSTFNGTRRYLIQPGSSSAVQSTLIQDMGTNVDMGVPQTLNAFIAWGKANYPAQRYALVLWDHGNGWKPKQRRSLAPVTGAQSKTKPAFSYDGQTGNAIQIWQLPQALGSQHLDMVVWDCSLMQMAEDAYELRNNTRYVVGSEESPPGTGFPYNTVLANFQNSPGNSTLSLAETWVDDMNAVAAYETDPIEESVVDTTALTPFCASGGPIDLFANALIAGEPGDLAVAQQVRAQGKSYLSTINARYFYDLGDMAELFGSLSADPNIQTAAANVLKGLPSVVVYEKHNSFSSGSEGLSIDYSPSSAFLPAEFEYDELDFAQSNNWGKWLASPP